MLTTKVIEYNKLNAGHDYTYQYSDDSYYYNKGSRESITLNTLYQNLSEYEKDLVGLYNNFILKRILKLSIVKFLETKNVVTKSTYKKDFNYHWGKINV